MPVAGEASSHSFMLIGGENTKTFVARGVSVPLGQGGIQFPSRSNTFPRKIPVFNSLTSFLLILGILLSYYLFLFNLSICQGFELELGLVVQAVKHKVDIACPHFEEKQKRAVMGALLIFTNVIPLRRALFLFFFFRLPRIQLLNPSVEANLPPFLLVLTRISLSSLPTLVYLNISLMTASICILCFGVKLRRGISLSMLTPPKPTIDNCPVFISLFKMSMISWVVLSGVEMSNSLTSPSKVYIKPLSLFIVSSKISQKCSLENQEHPSDIAVLMQSSILPFNKLAANISTAIIAHNPFLGTGALDFSGSA
jgi:hypothetical protein